MRLALTIVAVCLLAHPALAATYWVSPTGSGAASGADSAANAKTLAWFNANAVAGDVCRFKSGTYTDAIAPVGNGTAASTIRYYGFPQDRGAVRVANIQFGDGSREVYRGSYCTARWFTTTSGLTGAVGTYNYMPVGDSLVAITCANAGNITIEADSCVYDSLTITGSGSSQDYFFGIYGNKYLPWLVNNQAVGNVVKNSTFNWTFTGTTDCRVIYLRYADRNTFFNNTFNITKTTNGGYFFGALLFNTERTLFQNNVWNLSTVQTSATRGVWSLRDSSCYNRWLGNTVTTSGTGTTSFLLSNSGSEGWEQTTHHNYFGYNTIKVPNPQVDTGVLHYQDGIRGDTLEANIVATSSTNPLLRLTSVTDNQGAVIRQNTFFTAGAIAVDLSGGSGNHTPESRLSRNVYYCQTANSIGASNLKVLSGVELDSAGVFFSLGSSSAQYAIDYGSVRGVPGSDSRFGGSQSMWCSPQLADSNYATLDGRVTALGCAVGAVWPDGYAGAGVSGADTTPPVVTISAPTDTTYIWTTSETMPLAWTATDGVGVTSITIQWGAGVSPSTWSTVVSGLSGATTSYNWSLPSFSSGYGTFRVLAYDAAGNVGEDTQVFRCNFSEPERDTMFDTP